MVTVLIAAALYGNIGVKGKIKSLYCLSTLDKAACSQFAS